MTKTPMKSFLQFIPLIFICALSSAQPIYVGQPIYYELVRTLQVAGKLESKTSFTINNSASLPDMREVDNLVGSPSAFQFKILPVTLQTKFNSHNPYGWNDAGMIMAKGLQTQISGGIYAKAGPLTIQLRPEYVWAANPSFDTTPGYGSVTQKNYNRRFLGQSSIRLNAGPLSIGISTENLWWGPGQFSSLLMSNNIPGFLHLTFNTRRPIKTPIGAFEWQLIAAKLSEDTTLATESGYLKPTRPKNDWRYLSAMVLNYQPAFLPHTYLGIIGSVQMYNNDRLKNTGFVKKYLPIFAPASPTQNAQADDIPADGQFSFFVRQILPKHKFEFYVEYGYNDYKQNLRDLWVNPSHAAAWIIGMKKIVALKPSSRTAKGSERPYLDLSFEATQLAQTTSYILRNAGNWYTHGAITQGLTNEGQIMGAGSGLGNNVQTLQIKKIEGLQQIGLKLQRIQQDPKGLQGSGLTLGMRDYQWTDISVGLLGNKRWNNIMAGGEIQFVSSKNYGWNNANAFNLYATAYVSYFFK